VIEAARAGLREQSAGLVQVPPRTTVDSTSGHGWLRLMPAVLNGSKVMGFKAMHSTTGVGVGYIIALYDLPTGILLAQLDADWITSQRTAATAAVAVDELAAAKINQVGIIGSSEQARAMLAAVSQVRKFSAVNVFSPTPANRKKFADEMGEKLNLNITPVASPDKAVKGCDLVLSVYRAGSEPVISGDWLEAGAHMCSVSAVRPVAREIDDSVWKKSTAVIVDDREHVFESGDGLSILRSGTMRKQDATELWEVVGKQKPGRTKAGDITLYKAVGYALQDLVVANAVYERAKSLGLGHDTGEFPRLRK
jgi:ornithine cyclodeaminase/alanine dehydrogenase-like protein (mu-crystallin family)